VDPRSSRQFNIIKQAKDYDPTGAYVAHYIPRLAEVYKRNQVSLEWIHHPWTISAVKDDLLKDEDLKMYAQTPKFEQRSWKNHYKRRTDNEENKAGRSGMNGKGGKKKGLGPGGGKLKEKQREEKFQKPGG